MAFGLTWRRQGSQTSQSRPPYALGDAGTWTQRGPIGVTPIYGYPPAIGTTVPFTNMAWIQQMLAHLYPMPGVTPNGNPAMMSLPKNAQIGPNGTGVVPPAGTYFNMAG